MQDKRQKRGKFVVLKANVGWSKGTDGYTAGKLAAEKAMKGLQCASFAVLYGSVDYNQADLVRGVAEVLGDVPMIGCSSFTAVLTPDGVIGGKDGFCSVMVLDDHAMSVAAAGVEKGECARMAGRQAAEQAMEKLGKREAPAYFYMIAPPGEEETYLNGIQDVIGRVPFFGGSSADNTMEGLMKQYANGKVIENGVAVAFFYTDKKFGNKYTGDYRYGGKTGVITKVENKRTLKEIDGKPALEVYAGWRGMKTDDLKGLNLLGATIHAPLGMIDPEGEITLIRHPVSGGNDLSMAVGNDLVENTAVCMMDATTDELIASVGKAVAEAKNNLGAEPGALFLIHCGGRAAGIGDRMEEVVKEVKKAVGDLPFVGVLTFGEYGYDKWTKNACGGLMLSAFMLEK